MKKISRHLFALQVLAIVLMSHFSRAAETEPMDLPIKAQLPDPFALENGARLATPEQWRARREAIKAQLAFYEYGALPPAPDNVRVVEKTMSADGSEHLVLSCGPHGALKFTLDLRLPAGKSGPFPVLICGDALFKETAQDNAATADQVLARGYALAQFARTDFAPDDASRQGGVYAIYPDCSCGVLGAWAWGSSRVVDYLLTRPDIQSQHIAIVGHSRGGKAALLAGALDERIALTVGAQSGTGGASPYRIAGKGSESLEKITARFGYWFVPRLKEFAGRESQLPFDQHFLLSLIAPRSLLLLNARADPYANAPAAQQTFLAAREAFDFLDASTCIGTFYRAGGHFFGPSDCRALLDFADWQFFKRPTTTDFSGPTFADEAPSFSWRAP